MLKDVHHVSMYGLDLGGVQQFLGDHFDIAPVRVEGFENGAQSAAGLLKPRVAIFPVGPSVLEYMEPRSRMGVHYDYIRRNEGRPTISHICWRVVDIATRIKELVARGADLAELVGKTGEAGVSPHGGYRVMNVFAEETVRGLRFQLAESLNPQEIEAIETGHLKTRTHMKSMGESDDHRWLSTRDKSSMLTHVHHVVYQVWGLDYVVDLMKKVFGVRPFDRREISSEGFRVASYRFGRTIAHFEEPTKFGNHSAHFALTFGSHSGFAGGAASHVGFGIKDLDSCVKQLRKAGVQFVQPKPVASKRGSYRIIEVEPNQVGGLALRLCEDTT